MAKQSYTEILTQVQSLQEQAEQVRKQEMGLVIEKIREAVAVYKLTPEDIFGKEALVPKTDKAARLGKPSKGKASAAATEGQGYRLGDNYWVGMGKRPNLFKEALAAGKTPEEMRA